MRMLGAVARPAVFHMCIMIPQECFHLIDKWLLSYRYPIAWVKVGMLTRSSIGHDGVPRGF